MGLDIIVRTDRDEQIFTPDYYDRQRGYCRKHNLSRTFCNFMCRQYVIGGEPELDQIGKITSVDISPLYAMERYANETGEGLEYLLESAKSEEEKQKILEQLKQNRDNLKGNIDTVLSTIHSLIEKLYASEDWFLLLNDNGLDTLDYKNYFTNFNTEKEEENAGANFGQDLRKLQSFLEYAKEKGATTVYFNYG